MEREVERLLAQLDGKRPPSSPAPKAPTASELRPPTSPATIVWATTAPSPAVPAPVTVPSPVAAVESSSCEPVALWGRVLLGTSLALMMAVWPYAHSCGWSLLGYSVAVVTLLVAGGWIALSAWKQHNGQALILAFLLFYWGLVLAAELVLPRIGYASIALGWRCSVAGL